MYAVMRFGKSFTSLCCAKAMNAKFVLVVSGKADVADEWKENVQRPKILDGFCFVDSNAMTRNEKIISESAIKYEKETGKKMYATEAANLINEMNDCGRVIHIGGKEALETLNRLQRESASIGAILETFEGIADEVKVVGNKIRLRTAFGETMYLPLDKYVSNLITNYVYSL